jgi:glycerophosphoryl diester phosphodiesterase
MLRTAWFLTLLGVLLVDAMEAARAADQPAATAAQRVFGAGGPLIIAHRGDSKIAPENTLPAFELAVKAGADLVELDYHHSADGVPVVFHDGELDRCSNAVALWGGSKIKLAGKNLAELKLLDAGSWFQPEFAGTRIATLDEALTTIQSGSMTLIERKSGDPTTCVELLKRRKLLDRVVVQAFDWDFLAGCHKLDPTLLLGALGSKQFTPERLDEIARTGARVVGWEDRFTTAETIDAIHRRGWKAWVWTVDSPERAVQLVTAKIDGIITNRPAEIRAAVAKAAPNPLK